MNIYIRYRQRGLRAMRAMALAVVVMAGCTQARAQQDSTIVYDESNPLIYEDAWDLWPYVFLNENGEPDGYNIDLLRMMLKELDIPYVIKLRPTPEAVADLENGKSDLMLHMDSEYFQTSATASNAVVQIFTNSIVMPKHRLLDIKDGHELRDYTVIVHNGSFSHDFIKQHGWAKEIIAFEDMKEAFQKVVDEDEGIILWNTMSMKWLMRKYKTENLQLQAIDFPYGEYKFFSKDRQLLAKLDSVYNKFRATDRLTPIQNKWFYPDRKDTGIPSWIWKLAAILGAIFVCAVLYYLSYKMREHKMTREVRKSNDRLSLVLKTSSVRFWTYNVGTKIFTWMDEDGKPQKEYTVLDFSRNFQTDDFKRILQAIDNVIRKGEAASFNIQTPDDGSGEERDYTIAFSVLRRDKIGRPSVILCTRSDITEDRIRQERTKDMMLRYQSIFETAMVDMVYYDADGVLYDLNEKACKTFHCDRQELIARHVTLQEVTGLKDFDIHSFSYFYATQILNIPAKDGDDGRQQGKSYYEQQLVPVHDRQGNLLGIYGTGRDVTEVARSYQRLQDNIRDLQQANDEVSSYVKSIDYVLSVGGIRMATYDPVSHTLSVYSEINRVEYALTQTRVLGLVDEQSKKTAQRVLNSMDNQTANAISADIKTAIRKKGGNYLWLQLHFVPTYDDGKLTGYFGMCRDISEIKAVEEKLAQETLRAQEVEVVKNAFLHNMSFEIRTPLNTVVGFAELFQQEHSAEDAAVFIQEMKDSSVQLLKLINDILFLSRLDAEMIEIKPRPVDFSKTIEQKCEVAWANGRKPGVVYQVKNNFNKLEVEVDDPNLSIVMEKIITNAVQHTEKGSVTVRFDYMGDRLFVAVEDTGCGIEESMREHIFERFVTGASSGAGLGLSICHELIGYMGGEINLQSTVGKGTTVWFTLPCKLIEMERI